MIKKREIEYHLYNTKSQITNEIYLQTDHNRYIYYMRYSGTKKMYAKINDDKIILTKIRSPQTIENMLFYRNSFAPFAFLKFIDNNKKLKLVISVHPSVVIFMFILFIFWIFITIFPLYFIINSAIYNNKAINIKDLYFIIAPFLMLIPMLIITNIGNKNDKNEADEIQLFIEDIILKQKNNDV